MESFTDLPVALPGLRVARGTTTSLHTGIKEHWGIGRIDGGDTEWWGGGRVRRSVPGCILLKQPGDVVRHLVHRGPTVFTVVTLPTDEVARVVREGEALVTPQFEPGDPRAAPFHRLLDAACSGEDRFTLEVALAEALQGLGMTRGVRPSELAPLVGFYDQAQLTRHFRRLVGTTPARYVKSPRDPRFRGVLRPSPRP